MNIAEVLQTQAERNPQSAAIIEHNDRISFQQLENAVAKAAGLLQRHGLTAGDPVLVFQPISIELYIALLAVFRLGLIAVFIDPQAGRAHIERCCQSYPPKAMIASSKAHLLRLLSPAIRRIPVKFSIGHWVPGAIPWARRLKTPALDYIHDAQTTDPALITFTSGSTGRPKAAVRSHGFLMAQHRVLEQSLKLQAGETDLTTLPIFVLANLASGLTSVFPNADLRFPGAIDAAKVLWQIDKTKPSRSAASPAFFAQLADYCESHQRLMESFRQLYTGGAPVFPRLLDRLQTLAPQAEVIAVYGSTEAEPIAHISRHQIQANEIQAMTSGKGLLVGAPVCKIQLRILPDRWGEPLGPYSPREFEALCLAHQEIGEIVVSGEHVLPGYLHGVGDKDSKFDVDEQRWHRTGDAGYLDYLGRLWLLGRCAARITDQHGVLYPFTVECAAYQQPGIRRAALAAINNRRILVIEPDKHIQPDLTALHHQLAWAHLAEIKSVKRIPVDKRHNAKIDYPALSKMLTTRGDKNKQ